MKNIKPLRTDKNSDMSLRQIDKLLCISHNTVKHAIVRDSHYLEVLPHQKALGRLALKGLLSGFLRNPADFKREDGQENIFQVILILSGMQSLEAQPTVTKLALKRL